MVRDALAYCMLGGQAEVAFFTHLTRISGDVPAGHEAKAARQLGTAVQRAARVRGSETPESDTDFGSCPEAHDCEWVAPGAFLGLTQFTDLFSRLERYIKRTFAEHGVANYWTPPAGISLRTLLRSGYLSAFPQHVVGLSAVRLDLDSLDAATDMTKTGEFADLLGPLDCALSPALCLHVFEKLTGSVVDFDSLRSVGLVGTCGRYEAGVDRDPRRLLTYRLAEVVAVGSEDEVDEVLSIWRSMLEQMALDLHLGGELLPANDAFFGPTASELASFQSYASSKLEWISSGPYATALASINRHGRAYSERFDIRSTSSEVPIHSACIGFGLERMTFALMDAHGTSEDAWPAVLKRTRSRDDE